MAAPRPNFDHCVIHVSEWERSNAFYRDVLGAELIDRGHGASAYRFGAEQLNVHGPGVPAGPLARLPVAPGNTATCALNGTDRSTAPLSISPVSRSRSNRDQSLAKGLAART